MLCAFGCSANVNIFYNVFSFGDDLIHHSIIIYLTDHAFQLFQHGMVFARWIHYSLKMRKFDFYNRHFRNTFTQLIRRLITIYICSTDFFIFFRWPFIIDFCKSSGWFFFFAWNNYESLGSAKLNDPRFCIWVFPLSQKHIHKPFVSRFGSRNRNHLIRIVLLHRTPFECFPEV